VHRGAICQAARGPYTTCHNRFNRWRKAGIWDDILKAVADVGKATDQRRNTTIVRVPQRGANIPPRRNRKDAICFSTYLHRTRNHVERFFNRIKHCRRIAIRDGKLVANYLAFVKLAAIRLWLGVF